MRRLVVQPDASFVPSLVVCLAAALWLLSTPAARSANACEWVVRLDAVMVSSNQTAVGFPPLLPEPQNPMLFYTRKVTRSHSLQSSCYICHEEGHHETSDVWEYNPLTGAGPDHTAWNGTVEYHARTNGVASYDCKT